MKRLVGAVAIAIPVAWFATGWADHSGYIPNAPLMWLVSPGLMTLFHLPSYPLIRVNGFLTGLAIVGLFAVGVDTLYYSLIAYAVLSLFAAHRKISS